MPIGDKKRKQIAAAGGNESSGGNHGIIGGDTAPHSPRVPPTQPSTPRSSPPPLKPEVTMISASLDNPTLPSPGLEIVGISVRKCETNKWLTRRPLLGRGAC